MFSILGLHKNDSRKNVVHKRNSAQNIDPKNFPSFYFVESSVSTEILYYLKKIKHCDIQNFSYAQFYFPFFFLSYKLRGFEIIKKKRTNLQFSYSRF